MGTTSAKKAKPNQNKSPAQKKDKVSMCCIAPTLKQKPAANQVLAKQNGKNCTKIVAKFNCGFKNALSIRGEGIKGLNWNQGCPMKNVNADEWCWETTENFHKGQFKILINDNEYELGDNHVIESGKSVVLVPNFNPPA